MFQIYRLSDQLLKVVSSVLVTDSHSQLVTFSQGKIGLEKTILSLKSFLSNEFLISVWRKAEFYHFISWDHPGVHSHC